MASKWNIDLARTVVVLLAAIATTAQAASPAKRRVATYSEAKAIALRDGFRPMQLDHKLDTELCFEDDFCKKRPEVFLCRGADIYICDFAYERARDHRHLVIETIGEDSIHVKEVRAANRSDEREIGRRVRPAPR